MRIKSSTYDLIRVTNASIEWMVWESIGRELTPIEYHRFLSTLDSVDDRLFEMLDKKIVESADNSAGQWDEVDKAFKKYHLERK